MGGLLAALEQLPKKYVYGNALAITALIALLDWVSGEDVTFSFFYIVPILLVTWAGGRIPGLALNALCAGVRLAFVVHWQGHDPLGKPGLYWSLVMEGVFFITLTFIAAALRDLTEQQRLLARTDALTGVANRRAFYERAELELSRSRRLQEAVTVAYLDVDNFKRVNDELGHEAGDELLRSVAETFVHRVRSTDLVARLGGDEFALLLSSTGTGAARTLLSELYETLGSEMARSSWPVTFSIGAVTFLRPPVSADDMLRRVDELMYQVKREGKAGVKHAVFPELSRDAVEKSSSGASGTP